MFAFCFRYDVQCQKGILGCKDFSDADLPKRRNIPLLRITHKDSGSTGLWWSLCFKLGFGIIFFLPIVFLYSNHNYHIYDNNNHT